MQSFHHRLSHSSVFSEIFYFLPYFEQLRLQGLSKRFYQNVVPKCLYQAKLSVHTRETIFSYSTEDDNNSLLWKFNVSEEKWKEIAPTNGPVQFANSMSGVVATDMNRVFFFGGSLNEEFSELSDQVFEWFLPHNTVNMKKPMPIALLDPGVCYDRGYIYMVCGFTNVDKFLCNKYTLRYDILKNIWVVLFTC